MANRDIARHFDFEPAGRRLEDLETPVPVIDLDVVERNLTNWQQRCDGLGIANRPHIKTHKMVPLAKAQLALGAKGITVQKLGEAEVMADSGITDLFLTFNILGESKLKRLAELARRTEIKVVADNETVVEGLGRAGAASGRKIDVLVECDTGMKRNGVQSPQAAAALARKIEATKGLRYGGLMTYPKPGMRREVAAYLSEAMDLAGKAGLETMVVSTGGAPEMWKDEGLEVATEYRTGTYVFCDRSLVERKICALQDCALTVLATVVSRPAPERMLVDAGSKALTSDLLGMAGYGVIPALGGIKIYEVNEEHGYVDMTASTSTPSIGDQVRILPNHVCPVVNLFDNVIFVRGNEVLGRVKVDARGLVQ